MNQNINYSRLIEIMENMIERQEKEIYKLQQENTLLKASSKTPEISTSTHTGRYTVPKDKIVTLK